MSANRLRNAAFAAGAALALALTACDTPVMVVDDKGYTPLGGVDFIYHWAPGHDIAIYVDTREEPEGVDLKEAVRAGIAAWQNVALLGEVRMTMVDDVHAADVIVHHADAAPLTTIDTDICPFPVDLGGGRTYFCVLEGSGGARSPATMLLNDGSGGHVKMDVRINVRAISDIQYFDAIVAHELGHVIGIGAHSPSTSDLMNGTPRVFVPSADDAATMRYVLSRPAGVRF